MEQDFGPGVPGFTAHRHDLSHNNVFLGLLFRLATQLRSWQQFAWREVQCLCQQRETRHLFLLACLFFSVVALQMAYGYSTGSLAMVALGLATSHRLMALFVNLVSMCCYRHKPSESYSYGYQRMQVVVAFTGAVLLAFCALFVIFEVLEHIITGPELPEINTSSVLVISVMGMVLNLVAIVGFKVHLRAHGSESRTTNDDFDSTFWGIVSSIVMTLGIVLSAFMSQWNVIWADTTAAIACTLFLMYEVLPSAKSMGRVLLQTTPLSIKDRLDRSLREASTYEGVLECRNEHFWTQAPSEYVGSFYVRVKPETDEQLILAKMHNLFSSFIHHLAVQVEKEELDVGWSSLNEVGDM
ncbi:Cation diffusion facilitator family transporter superfamily protein [Balamuthia mandrillaris]